MPENAHGKRQQDKQKNYTEKSAGSKDEREGKMIFGIVTTCIILFLVGVLSWALFSGTREVNSDFVVTIASITENESNYLVTFSDINSNPGMWSPKEVILSPKDASKLEVGGRYHLILSKGIRGGPSRISGLIGPL